MFYCAREHANSMTSPDQGDWSSKIPLVEFAINSTASESTGYSPFELMYGFIPSLVNLPPPNTPHRGIRQWVESAQFAVMAARDNVIAARVKRTHHANRHRRADPVITVSSLV
jgi:hypothetical protein